MRDRSWEIALWIALLAWIVLAPPSCHSPFGRGGSGHLPSDDHG